MKVYTTTRRTNLWETPWTERRLFGIALNDRYGLSGFGFALIMITVVTAIVVPVILLANAAHESYLRNVWDPWVEKCHSENGVVRETADDWYECMSSDGTIIYLNEPVVRP